jgi:hypothetical protein
MKQYDILELQTLSREELIEVANFYEIPVRGKYRRAIIYAILEKQTLNAIFSK